MLVSGCGGGAAAASSGGTSGREAAPPPSPAAPADTTPPTVTSTRPGHEETNAPIDTVISVTFDESIDPSTLDRAVFGIADASNRLVDGTVRYSGTTAIFTPSEALAPAETYTATIGAGIADTAGNALGTAYSWTFTTGLARYALTAVGEDPAGDVEELFTLVNDLNENGDVIGEAVKIVNLHEREPSQESIAFLWRDGRLTDLGALSDVVRDSRSQGINDRSEVVGWSYPGVGRHPAFHWKDGEMTAIDLEDAVAINNDGQIVGFVTRSDNNEALSIAAMWAAGRTIEMDGLAQPWNINEAGDVVGFAYVAQRPQAALWRAGRVTLLGALPQAHESQAFDINIKGQVVGTSRFAPPAATEHYERAFLWQDGRLIELPRIEKSHSSSSAYGINDRGHVVGRSGAAQFTATVWIDETPYDLNELISDDDPLKPYVTLLEAREINNRGKIIAQGTDSRRSGSYTGYLLIPTGPR